MKWIFGSTVRIKLTVIVLAILILINIICLIYYFKLEATSKVGVLLGGVAAGLIVAIFQFIIAWDEHRVGEKLKSLQIDKVLFTRDDINFYKDFINSSTSVIDIMGVSANRLMRDFADQESIKEEKKVLLRALDRKVKVRILVANKDQFLKEEELEKFTIASREFAKVKILYSNFEFRYYKHVPTHSIFRVDEKSILGPVFPTLRSEDTPALLFKNSSHLAIKYLDYFESEWKKAI